MHYGFIAERASIEMRLALGQISEAEYLRLMTRLVQSMRDAVFAMSVACAVAAFIVVGGLALLALRLGTFQ